MKRFSILCILSVLVVLCTYSQEQSFSFGKISQWEKDLKTYQKDTEAEAVVLFDIGKSSFLSTDNGLVIIFERKRRIKILKESGITYAEVDITSLPGG